jgi:Uma2 family endonuclease
MEAVEKRLFTRKEYHQLAEKGILDPDERVELIRGEIITMSPAGKNHASIVRRLNMLLAPRLSPDYIIDVQNPLILDDYSEPEPDLMILPHRDDFYQADGVQGKDVLLLIEVAHSSLKKDTFTKLPLYAEHGIPEVWIIDVESSVVNRYTKPERNAYRNHQVLQSTDTLQVMQVKVTVKEVTG